MTLDLGLSDASLRLDSGSPGYEVYPFYCSSSGGTQQQFVTLLLCRGDGIKKGILARERLVYVYALDGSKNTTSILKIEV